MKQCFAAVLTRKGVNHVVRVGDTAEILKGEMMPDAVRDGEVIRQTRIWPCQVAGIPDGFVGAGTEDIEYRDGVVVITPHYVPAPVDE